MKKRMFQLATLLIGLALVFSLTGCADGTTAGTDPETKPDLPEWKLPDGQPRVYQDDESPTGYFADFEYVSETATKVTLSGNLMLQYPLDPTTGVWQTLVNYPPEKYKPGMLQGSEYMNRDMTQEGNTWICSRVPVLGGQQTYWFVVTDPEKGWSAHDTFDPNGVHPRPEGIGTHRSIIYTPYHTKMASKVLEQRAYYNLPRRDPAERGKVEYIKVPDNDTAYIGTVVRTVNLGIYTPAGYSEGKKPYKVIYAQHGGSDNIDDLMIPANLPVIIDNMVARGELDPTVVVTYRLSDGGYAGDVNTINDRLVNFIIPYIEEHYNVSAEQTGRAMCGFSQGGSYTFIQYRRNITNDTHLFGYYCTMDSGGISSVDSSRLSQADVNALSDQVQTGLPIPHLFSTSSAMSNYDDFISLASQKSYFNKARLSTSIAVVDGCHEYVFCADVFVEWARNYLWKEPLSVKVPRS